jgi:peptidoglycan/LPS O-acetylase OafA/YrhL
MVSRRDSGFGILLGLMAGRFALPYYPGLDGLRAVAVAGVLAFHSGFDWARGGHLGVSTFFTLSGFLITLLLIVERERTGRIALPAFWARRFRRLMPAALMGLGGIALFSALVADPGQLQRIRGEGLAACGYVVNWWFILTEKTYADLFASPSPVQHYWSLSIEEQFYAVFPALVAVVLAVGRGSRRVLAVIIAALALSSTVWMAVLHDSHRDPSRVYYGTDTRAAELLVGALLALWMFRGGRLRTAESSRSTAIIGMIAFPAMLVPWGLATTYTPRLLEGGYALYSIATAFVVAAAVRPGPLRSLLALRPLREVGRISYGVYLYHWPIYLWLSPERTGLDRPRHATGGDEVPDPEGPHDDEEHAGGEVGEHAAPRNTDGHAAGREQRREARRLDAEEAEDGDDQDDVEDHRDRRSEVAHDRRVDLLRREARRHQADGEADQPTADDPDRDGAEELEPELCDQRCGDVRCSVQVVVEIHGTPSCCDARLTNRVVGLGRRLSVTEHRSVSAAVNESTFVAVHILIRAPLPGACPAPASRPPAPVKGR